MALPALRTNLTFGQQTQAPPEKDRVQSLILAGSEYQKLFPLSSK